MSVKYLLCSKIIRRLVGNSFKGFAIVIFILLAQMPVPAIAQKPLTLKEAINNAFVNRKNIQSGKSNLGIQKLETEILYKKYWPQISLEYNYLYNPILQTSILPIGIFNPSYPPDATKNIQFGTKWSQTAGITVIQPLLDQSIRRQIIEAKLQERMAAATQAQSEYELAYTVAQTYLDISLQQAKIESAIADTARTFISYNLLKNKFDEKRLLKSDLNKSIINHNNTRQLFSDAIADLIADKVYLLFLTGQVNIEQADITIDTGFFKIDKILAANTNPDFELIPEFQQLELEGQLKSMQAKSEKAKYLPTLSFKGFIGANQYTNNFDPVAANSWFGLSYVGVYVKMPLLFGEDKKKKLQQLQLQASQYHLQKEDKAAQYSKDAITAEINMGQIVGQLKTQEENLLLTNESIVIMQARVLEGQESASNLNLEEANLQQLQSTHETSKRQLWLYWLDYQKASGRLGLLWK
jgi:outer membrane protein TolC